MTQAWQIPFTEFQFEYARSRGPGGQNVNRTNSAVILRWNLWASEVFTIEQKERIAEKLQSKLTIDGELLIRSEEQRDQDQNRKKCIEKLNETLKQALFVHKKRIKTKPKKSAVRKRLDNKKIHSEKKKLRGKSWD